MTRVKSYSILCLAYWLLMAWHQRILRHQHEHWWTISAPYFNTLSQANDIFIGLLFIHKYPLDIAKPQNRWSFLPILFFFSVRRYICDKSVKRTFRANQIFSHAPSNLPAMNDAMDWLILPRSHPFKLWYIFVGFQKPSFVVEVFHC